MDNVQEESEKVSHIISSNIETGISFTLGDFDKEYLHNICVNAKDNLDVEYALVYNKRGEVISNTPDGGLNFKEIVQSTLKGTSENTLLATNKDLYSVASAPIKFNGNILGALVVANLISTDKFVEEIGEMYDIHATYFSGYTRSYTTIPGLKGKQIVATDAIDKAMNGERVLREGTIEGQPYLVDYFPIKDSSGKVHSVFFIGKEMVAIDAISTSIFTPVLIIAVFLTLLMIGGFIAGLYFVIIKKLNFLLVSQLLTYHLEMQI